MTFGSCKTSPPEPVLAANPLRTSVLHVPSRLQSTVTICAFTCEYRLVADRKFATGNYKVAMVYHVDLTSRNTVLRLSPFRRVFQQICEPARLGGGRVGPLRPRLHAHHREAIPNAKRGSGSGR